MDRIISTIPGSHHNCNKAELSGTNSIIFQVRIYKILHHLFNSFTCVYDITNTLPWCSILYTMHIS
eukprot:Pgem_evm1s14809